MERRILFSLDKNEEIMFPSNGKECIAYFREHIRELVKIVEKATKQFDQQKEKTIKQEQVLDTAIEQF